MKNKIETSKLANDAQIKLKSTHNRAGIKYIHRRHLYFLCLIVLADAAPFFGRCS